MLIDDRVKRDEKFVLRTKKLKKVGYYLGKTFGDP